ncbi:DR1-associated protein 1 (negative cofactor 2 alpha), partial [Dissophora globulifera]
KALELFMQSLIDEACMETRAKNAKRLTAAHLKKTILDKDEFDFLRDIVQNVADPQGGAGSGSAAGVGAASDEGNHSSNNGSSSSNSGAGHHLHHSMKMEEDDKSYADFAGAMAAARRSGPARGAGVKKSVGKNVAKKEEDDDDYDNE